MGSCFSRTSLPIYKPRLVMQILDWRTESSFCGVYYGYGYGPDRVPPYGLKVVRNATDQDQDHDLRMDSNFDCYCCATTTALTLRKQGEDLIFAQIENSGAVLGTRGENNALFPVRLTANLKPHHLPAAT